MSIQHSKEIFIDYIIIRLNTCYNQDGSVFTYSRHLFLQPQPSFQNASNQKNINSWICFTSITSNVVAGLQNGHVRVFAWLLQSRAAGVGLGLLVCFKKHTFFFFQEIITLQA